MGHEYSHLPDGEVEPEVPWRGYSPSGYLSWGYIQCSSCLHLGSSF